MVVLLVGSPVGSLAARAAAAPSPAPTDTLAGPQTRNLLDLGLSGSDAWYVRGFDSLFARDDAGVGEAARAANTRIDEAFLPYAGLRIRRIWVLGRQAFGTLVADTAATVVEDFADTLVTRASTFTRFLNAVTIETQPFVIRNYLRFAEGDLVEPFALADSERLLRQLRYTSDAKIEVLPLPDLPGWADVVVLVRDRWPLGASAKVHTRDRYDVQVFHRNLGGLGLDLEFAAPYERGKTPETGWRLRGSLRNLGGSFVDISGEVQRDWAYDRTGGAIERAFVHPDIRLIGGLGLAREIAKNYPDLPPGIRLETEVRDTWFGWGIRLRSGERDARRRLRLVPAVRAETIDYLDPPLAHATSDRQWRDVTRYLVQLTLVGVDYSTARLVYGYGETEDLPSGTWAALIGGFESGEVADRIYHGVRFLWPTFTPGGRYVTLALGLGGYRHHGRIEDGVLDLFIGGFGPLRQKSYGQWRHFYGLSYTLGINRRRSDGLRLDTVALRDLEREDVAGNQRLAAEAESVLFTRYALLGFKAAAFGYFAGGFVGGETDFPASNRLVTNVAVGLRFNNPRLVFPTIEMRAGLLSSAAGTEAVLSVRMGDLGFLRREVPTAKPSTLPFL